MILSCLGVLVSDRRTDGRTNERTLVVVESLSRLKTKTPKLLRIVQSYLSAILLIAINLLVYFHASDLPELQ